MQAALARHGLQVDISSAGALQASLLGLQRSALPKGMMDSISQLLLRTMNVRSGGQGLSFVCWCLPVL